MRPGRLILAARRLAEVLPAPSAVAGGLAVAAWGEVRATRDVDFVTLVPLEQVERVLDLAGIRFHARRGDRGDLPWVVEGDLEGARFQVFAPRNAKPFGIVAVKPSGDEGVALPVVALSDLIRLKLEAGGPKDLWDVARLVRRHPAELGDARAAAGALGIETELDRWIERS